jgi:uncharacterized membrane protein YedE/YeeE
MEMTTPSSGFWIVLGLGVLFGFFLEAGGLGSPRKLTAQLSLRDWTVFKAMFVAIVVAAAALYLSDLTGLLDSAKLKAPTPFYGAMFAGGALLGLGMALGGYCPGTSVIGLFSGRLDAVFFILGMSGGVYLFAYFCGDLQWLFLAGKGAERETLVSLTGLPAWLILLALAGLTAAGFRFGSQLEGRGDGVVEAKHLAGDP